MSRFFLLVDVLFNFARKSENESSAIKSMISMIERKDIVSEYEQTGSIRAVARNLGFARIRRQAELTKVAFYRMQNRKRGAPRPFSV